ncbi:Histidine kinase-, DNA gyrase B-, and HSP90-like ATPase [Hymenobacter daecheongensis DSM 21074]|uniref:Histidine kinase-, DNA gyrase B-, and HSP90-like ATPase n=1 Tax=Hymenobacter daecheongensis DSM 21074 TaxID=1121955 RepID=A0A1M6GAP7_9BACT|nr:tetratricopeptide repeat protein [Hymenobacter daecheongensis]SHJ07028.1 Histidine kinase-, DNA gyrase B-, and HSP90-like ATPase [Hymenobacter daecheongensis DSM 21074]
MKQVYPVLLLFTILFGTTAAPAQSPQTAGLKQALARATTDTTRVLLLADISASYRYSRFDSVMHYAWRGLNLAQRIKYRKGEGRCLSRIGILMSERGNLPQALRIDLDALQLNQASRDWEGTARTLNQTGLLYHALEDYRPALGYFFRAKKIYETHRVPDDSQIISVLTNIGAGYEGLHQLDSAAYFLNRAWELTSRSRNVHQSPWGNPAPYVLRELGLLQAKLGHNEEALRYYRRSAQAAVPENDLRSACRAYQYMAELFRTRQQSDSSIYYARKALVLGQQLPFVIGVVRTSSLLNDAFQARQQPDSALKYMRIMLTAQDSLYNPQRIKQLDAIGFAEQQRLRQLEEAQLQYATQVRTYALLAGTAFLLLAALLLWRNNRQKRTANRHLQELNEQIMLQKAELTTQRDNLARTLLELKATQSQLVLREKMASLGELMAGVAHEIQMPTHAIKDLAGISVSLCQELSEELAKGTFSIDDLELMDEMLRNLSQYQAKIGQHSQRAESIVRGMLEYSGNSPGPRQPTDLNTLAEDYLRLTYHDLRAKSRHFNAALLPQLDPAVGLVDVVRQDLGRALVSLFANAMQAVQQRQRLGEEDYVPQVMLSTKRAAQHIEIRVRNNGLSLTEEARANVFQRVFTPQPEGETNSLSLALSYDIIKGHGGTLTLEPSTDGFTEFLITLPVRG